MSIVIEMKVQAKTLLGRAEAEVILHANSIEEMEKLVELQRKVKVDVELS